MRALNSAFSAVLREAVLDPARHDAVVLDQRAPHHLRLGGQLAVRIACRHQHRQTGAPRQPGAANAAAPGSAGRVRPRAPCCRPRSSAGSGHRRAPRWPALGRSAFIARHDDRRHNFPPPAAPPSPQTRQGSQAAGHVPGAGAVPSATRRPPAATPGHRRQHDMLDDRADLPDHRATRRCRPAVPSRGCSPCATAMQTSVHATEASATVPKPVSAPPHPAPASRRPAAKPRRRRVCVADDRLMKAPRTARRTQVVTNPSGE